MLLQITFGPLLVVLLGTIAWIDLRKMIIPDALNLALAMSGFAYQWIAAPESVWLHLVMAGAAYTVLRLIRHLHFKLTGRVGLGMGDVKMIGAAMLWIDGWNMPIFIFVASAGALIFVLLRGLASVELTARQPFGPFLGLGLLTAWLMELPLPETSGL
jgi:leader peptidase (prepilin peptidase)/N-methyltransferase